MTATVRFVGFALPVVAACWTFFPGSRASSAEAGRRPNVVVILTDDQRWDAMSCAGHPFLKTPNLDRLAREGVRFANAFATTSLCSPSRTSMLTGLYMHRHGVRDNFSALDPALPTFPRLLQGNGYRSGFFGKWHMGGSGD